jgi:hypothetical protein
MHSKDLGRWHCTREGKAAAGKEARRAIGASRQASRRLGNMTEEQVDRVVETLCEQLQAAIRLKGTQPEPPRPTGLGIRSRRIAISSGSFSLKREPECTSESTGTAVAGRHCK